MTENDNLTVQQQNAIDVMILGWSDREVAEEVGVARPTVTDWRNHNEHFAAELNRRRCELWRGHADQLRNLVGQAVRVLEQNLDAENAALRQAAAVHVLKAVGVYGSRLDPDTATTPEEIRAAWEGRENLRQIVEMTGM